MTPIVPRQLISRTTILIICGVLAGIMVSVQIPFAQRINVAASCLIGIVAFVAIDERITSSQTHDQSRKLEETRDTLNRRIEVQLASLESTIRKIPDVARAIQAKQQLDSREESAGKLDSVT